MNKTTIVVRVAQRLLHAFAMSGVSAVVRLPPITLCDFKYTKIETRENDRTYTVMRHMRGVVPVFTTVISDSRVVLSDIRFCKYNDYFEYNNNFNAVMRVLCLTSMRCLKADLSTREHDTIAWKSMRVKYLDIDTSLLGPLGKNRLALLGESRHSRCAPTRHVCNRINIQFAKQIP